MKSIIIGGLVGLSSAEPLGLVPAVNPNEALLIRSTRDAAPVEDQTRRYFQLTKMMDFFNPVFDERKYWTYGCNCLILGDRPMSDPGHGPPVDALDTVCKKYKDCLKCARAAHGEMCIGEFVKYKFSLRQYNNGNGMCQDTAGSCPRHLCECDAMFAQEHVAQAHVFTTDYHMFWSTLPNGWEPQEACPRGGGTPSTPQCCVAPDGPAVMFNADTHTCNPADGSVSNM